MAIKRKAMDETPTRGGGNDRKPTMRDVLPQVEWPKNAKFLRVRLYPGVVPVGFHDYPLYRKDGSPVISEKYKKHTTIPKICLAFNPETGEKDPDVDCPYCDAELYFKIEYWGEGVVEELKDKLPAKAKPSKAEQRTGFKDRENDGSATPVAPFRYTSKVFDRLKGLKQLNKVTIDGEKIPVGVDDEENGCWINMNFDEAGTGDGKYGLQKDEREPLEAVDEDYLRWDIEGAIKTCTEELSEAKRNAEWFLKHSKGDKGGDEDGDDGYEVGDYVEFVTDDDETVQGEISEMSDVKVTLTDADGDERSFRWKNIEDHKKIDKPGKKKSAPASKGKAKAEPEPDDDDYAPEEGDYVKVLDADDDEVAAGVVEDVDSKTVTVAGEAYRKAKHTFVKATAPKKKAKAEPEPEPEDDDYEPEEGDYVKVLDADDDEVAVGSVEEVDSKTVTVDGEAYRKAKHTFVKAEKPKGKGKAKAEPEPEPESDDDDFTPDEGDFVKVLDADDDLLAEGKVTEIDKKTVTIEDADGEEQLFKLAKVTLKPGKKPKAVEKPAKGKAKPADDDDDDDKTPPRKAGKSGGRSFNFDDDD